MFDLTLAEVVCLLCHSGAEIIPSPSLRSALGVGGVTNPAEPPRFQETRQERGRKESTILSPRRTTVMETPSHGFHSPHTSSPMHFHMAPLDLVLK